MDKREFKAGYKSGKDTIIKYGYEYTFNYWKSKFTYMDQFSTNAVISYWIGYGKAIAEKAPLND